MFDSTASVTQETLGMYLNCGDENDSLMTVLYRNIWERVLYLSFVELSS